MSFLFHLHVQPLGASLQLEGGTPLTLSFFVTSNSNCVSWCPPWRRKSREDRLRRGTLEKKKLGAVVEPGSKHVTTEGTYKGVGVVTCGYVF